MEMDKVSFNGIGELVATFKVDSGTLTSIGADYGSACGKAVALTANDTVGYGTSGSPVFGVIKSVEKDGVAAVQIKGFAVDIEYGANAPTFGGIAAVNGLGKVVTVASDGPTQGAIVTAVDTTNEVCTIFM